MVLPLVTVTLTTDEMAMMSAGVILLRKFWVKRYLLDHSAETQTTIQHCTDFLNRFESLVTPEQGRDLLTELIRGKMGLK